MKTGPTTIKDIARKLNISPSTVSRALRNHPDISAETKNNVATLVEELDYHPNLIAASLQKRKTNTIGIIVPEIRHDFFSTVISGIEDVSYQADYTIMVCQSNEDSDKESKIIKALVSNRVDGLMISISQNTLDPAPFLSLKRQNVPFVFFDRIFDDINVSKVIVNDFESAEQAVEHLILRGYKRIAHLAGPEYISISKDRLQGYKSTLKKHGIPYQEELVIHGGFSEDDWRWVPRLVMKPGEETFWLPNYFIEMWGDRRMFSCGYNVQGQYLWPQVNSPDNTLVPGSWFHLTFIRDTSRNILLQITHDANRELVVFNVAEYDPITGNLPTQTSMPFHIGFGGGGADSWLDGFVDEIRISDVVREVPIPPIITEVTELENQLASVGSYEISANITTLFPSTTVQSATLHYNVGSGWQELPMAAAGDVYSASISGQPLGSVIKYYLSAVADNGLRAVMPVTAEGEDPFYYSFGVYAPNTQTLDLTFEEGTGTVIDHSDYGQAVTMVGNPTFAGDAAVGDHCIYLEGDSSYLEVDSPLLVSEEYTVDFWLNADSMHTYCRIINRPIDPGNWHQNAYQVRFNPDHRLYAGAWNETEGYLAVTLDDSLLIGKWYPMSSMRLRQRLKVIVSTTMGFCSCAMKMMRLCLRDISPSMNR